MGGVAHLSVFQSITCSRRLVLEGSRRPRLLMSPAHELGLFMFNSCGVGKIANAIDEETI